MTPLLQDAEFARFTRRYLQEGAQGMSSASYRQHPVLAGALGGGRELE